MTTVTVRNIVDAWVNSARTTTNYGGNDYVSVAGTTRYGYIRPNLPNFLGRTVTSATLRGRVHNATAAGSFTLRRLTEGFAEGWVTWARQPANTSTGAVTVSPGVLADGDVVSWDVTAHMQLVADGTKWHGWRLSTDLTSPEYFHGMESGEPAWELELVLADEPEQPENLRPDGGGAVSGPTPTYAWDFIDFGGESSVQGESRVQVDTPVLGVDPDEIAPDYDSGWVANVDPEFTPAHALVGAGPHFWRVQVRDAAGGTSDWSDWAEFTVEALPSLVIDTPTGNVGDPRVQVIAHLSSGTVGAWRITAHGPDKSDHRAGSGWRDGGPVEWEVPFKNAKGRRVFYKNGGWLRVEVFDSVDRAVAVGESASRVTWVPVTFADDAATVAPTGLTVSQAAKGDPRLTWSWSATDTADAWLLMSGDEVLVRIDGDDIAPVAGVYTYTDNGEVSPLRPQDLKVRAVRANKRSNAATLADWSHEVAGVWLLPENGDEPVQLAGVAVDDFSQSDRVATYEPMVGQPVDIIYDHVGMAGSFQGAVDARQDVWAALDTIESLRTAKARTVQLVWGSRSMRVRLRQVSHTPASDIMPNNLFHHVRFSFTEVD